MADQGRIEGRVSSDGTAYELVQFDVVVVSYPMATAQLDPKLKATIKRNSWEALP